MRAEKRLRLSGGRSSLTFRLTDGGQSLNGLGLKGNYNRGTRDRACGLLFGDILRREKGPKTVTRARGGMSRGRRQAGTLQHKCVLPGVTKRKPMLWEKGSLLGNSLDQARGLGSSTQRTEESSYTSFFPK